MRPKPAPIACPFGPSIILALLTLYLNDKVSPTPVEIGAAVTQLLGPGLTRILPWWTDFLSEAAQQNSAARLCLLTRLTFVRDPHGCLTAAGTAVAIM